MGHQVKKNKKIVTDLEEETKALGNTRKVLTGILQHDIRENGIKIVSLKEQNELHEKNIDEAASQVRIIEKENKKLRSLVVNYKMTESALETVLQSTLQISLILMSQTGEHLCFKYHNTSTSLAPQL